MIKAAIYIGGQYYILRKYRKSDEAWIDAVFDHFKSLEIKITKAGDKDESTVSKVR